MCTLFLLKHLVGYCHSPQRPVSPSSGIAALVALPSTSIHVKQTSWTCGQKFPSISTISLGHATDTPPLTIFSSPNTTSFDIIAVLSTCLIDVVFPHPTTNAHTTN